MLPISQITFSYLSVIIMLYRRSEVLPGVYEEQRTTNKYKTTEEEGEPYHDWCTFYPITTLLVHRRPQSGTFCNTENGAKEDVVNDIRHCPLIIWVHMCQYVLNYCPLVRLFTQPSVKTTHF